jgi:hypothetical protein
MPSTGAGEASRQAGAGTGEGWRVVPVERVSPSPSAPHTTPQHTGRTLEAEEDDMVIG